MTVLTETEVNAFVAGDNDKLAALVLTGPDEVVTEHPATAAFVFVGLDPNTDWLDGQVALDADSFIATDRMMQTSLPGVFAAGDVRSGSTKQLASAVGEGAAVALQIRHHLDAVYAGG
jgi:thioredoxin reductase (NADPH)